MAPKRRAASREEVLLKKRLRERERYKIIKNDPEKLEQQREKERLKYANKKKNKQVKSIKEMNDREARLKRKEWRVRSKKYYNKKKLTHEGLNAMPESPPNSDESRSASPVQRQSGRKRIHRDRSKIIQRNKRLLHENSKLKRMVEKYRKRCYRATMTIKNKESKNMTPRSKVKRLMNSKDKQLVRRRLLFGVALESQLKTNFENIQSPRLKKNFVSTVLGDGKVIKKCKITKELQKIFTKRLTRCNTNNYIKKRQHKLFKAQVQEDVKTFFNDDENTRLAPGKKDCKTYKKVKKQKRYVNDTMLNLHKKFLSAVPYTISYSLFCKYRPFYVVYQKVDGRDTCLCKVHMNTEFVVSVLNKNKVINARTPKELAEELCCNGVYNVSCLLRSCNDCKNKQISFEEFNGDFTLQYFQWELQKDSYTDKKGEKKEVKHTVKIKKTSTAIDLVNKLEMIMLRFMKHEAIILNQFSQLKYLKMCMKEDEALVHFDFSENYCLKYSNEIQSFHFGGSRQQITLHTTSLRYKDANNAPLKTKSFCTLSENLNHSATEVMAHLLPILKYINELKPRLRVLHLLSDGPSTQYRNKDMFYIFSHLIKDHFPHLECSTYNYFEAGHGKGTPDGIGGTIKRTADRLVAEGKDIASINDLSTAIKENVRKIETFVIKDSDIEDIRKKINYSDVKPFKGTIKVHQVVQLHKQDPRIELKMKTMSCLKCNDKQYDSYDCKHFTIGSLKYQHEIPTVATTSKEKVNTKYPDLTNDQKRTIAEMKTEKIDAVNATEEVRWDGIKPGQFLLVKFPSLRKNTSYRYVCSVQSKDEEDGEVTVQGLKLANESGNEFYVSDDKDISNIQFSSILQILPEPKTLLKNRQLVHRFPRKVDVFEQM